MACVCVLAAQIDLVDLCAHYYDWEPLRVSSLAVAKCSTPSSQLHLRRRSLKLNSRYLFMPKGGVIFASSLFGSWFWHSYFSWWTINSFRRECRLGGFAYFSYSVSSQVMTEKLGGFLPSSDHFYRAYLGSRMHSIPPLAWKGDRSMKMANFGESSPFYELNTFYLLANTIRLEWPFNTVWVAKYFESHSSLHALIWKV